MANVCAWTSGTPGFWPATISARTSATGLFVARASIPATAPSATLHCQNSAPLAGNWRMVARSPSDAWPR
jgi:hypothetical protein